MALPTTIAGVAFPVNTCDTRPFLSSGGNVYIVLVNSTTTTKLKVMKATDPASSFSEVDAANAPVTPAAIYAISVCQVGDVLHIATYSGASTNELKYHTFNMGTDLYAVKNETVEDTNPENDRHRLCSIHVRSDGNPIIVYGGTLDAL